MPSRPLPRRTTSKPPLQSSTPKEPIHLPLHRRLLFPAYPIHKPLPPIIKSSTLNPDIELINERLYHLIALALRAYVLSWYPHFTKDKTLLPILTRDVLVPIIRPILSRLQDNPERLLEFLLLDIPTILQIHITTYWESRAICLIHPKSPDSAGLSKAYHARLPLLAITDTSKEEEGGSTLDPVYLTALSDSLIRLYLPTKEYESGVERLMIRELVGRTVLGGIGRKLGEGWFWWSLTLRFLGGPLTYTNESDCGEGKEEEQGIGNWMELVLSWMTRLWATVIWVYATIWTTLELLRQSPPPRPQYTKCIDPWLNLGRAVLGIDGRAGLTPQNTAAKLVWGGVEVVVGLASPVVDRLLPHLTRTHILTSKTGLQSIDLIEKILFPLDGYPGPTPPDPSPEEAEELRRKVDMRLREVIPSAVRTVFFSRQGDAMCLLDPLADTGCNAHLVAMIMDALVGTVVPEMVVSSVDELSAKTEVER